jgi:uncharacterized protein YuzE
MKITYDRRVDAMYIDFKTGPIEAMTKEIVKQTIFFDYDEDDRLAGIEILGASKILSDPAAFKDVTLEKLGEGRLPDSSSKSRTRRPAKRRRAAIR